MRKTEMLFLPAVIGGCRLSKSITNIVIEKSERISKFDQLVPCTVGVLFNKMDELQGIVLPVIRFSVIFIRKPMAVS